MATINGISVFVLTEKVSRSTESTSHPVEQGIDITDHTKRSPVTVSLTGEIVGENAPAVLKNLTELARKGNLITYIGRNIFSNMQIQSFNTDHPYTIAGGCSFDMTLKEIRTANSSYSASANKNAGTQQIQSDKESGTKVYHTVKKGETAWYLGEKVYKSQGSSVGFIMSNNKDKVPNGDWTKLQVGTVLHVYNKK